MLSAALKPFQSIAEVRRRTGAWGWWAWCDAWVSRIGARVTGRAVRGLVSLVTIVTPGLAFADHVNLTPDQRAWLQAKGAVRLGTEADYGPFIFADAQGRIDGLSMDVLRLVQQRTGLQVQVQPPQPLSQVLQAARERRVDLVSSLRATPERGAYLDFSMPYVSVPAIVVVPQGAPASTDGSDALRRLTGRPVAVGQGYAVEAVVRQRFPGVRWLPVPDDVAGLKAVVEGRADAAVADAASVAFVVARQGLQGLRSAGRADFDYPLSFAVRKDWPELRAVLDEGIRAMHADERRALLARWAPELDTAQRTPRSPLATAVAVALIVTGLLLCGWWWLRHRAGRGA